MKRIISAMLTVLLCVLILAGCGQVQGESLSSKAESGSDPSTEEDEALAAKGAELCKQIHGNTVWLQNSADNYDPKRGASLSSSMEVNGAVVRYLSNSVFVYDVQTGKLRYAAEESGAIRVEAYSGKDGYDYRLLLNDSVVYRNTVDESKVLQEALPLGMQFELKEPNDEFYDCYDINENYFVWHDDEGIKLLDFDGGEPELVLSNEDFSENYKSILSDHPAGLTELLGERLYGCPRFICGGTKIVATAFKEGSICTGTVIYNIPEGKIELGHFIYEPNEAQYPLSDRYIMDDWYRIDAETDEIYKTAGVSGDPNLRETADGVTAVFYLYGLNGDGGQGEQRNLQLYLREIDHPQKYFRHIASVADPEIEATFTLLSSDYLMISINSEKFVVKYSE